MAEAAESPQSSGVAAEPSRAQAERFLQKGLDHYDREEFEEAYAFYHQAVSADPTFAVDCGDGASGVLECVVAQYVDGHGRV